MLLADTPGAAHLTYCTNIHPAEAWPDVLAGLRRHVPEIKAKVSPDRPFGVGLRLGAAAVHDAQHERYAGELKALLADIGAYVFTINGFPYGAFHGARVKEQVYAPDWGEDARLDYTDRLADLLAALLPEGVDGSLSTVPLTFRPWAQGRMQAMTRNLLAHAARLVEIERQSGKRIALALEPEPCCYLETIAETVAWFEAELFPAGAVARFAGMTGLSKGEAEAALRRHVGVCYDVCHAAVEYEDARGSLAALEGAGIAVPKVQLSSALRIAAVDEDTVRKLAPFAEPTYLHQVIERRGDTLTRFLDLPEALGRVEDAKGAEWRIHFHVPVFLEEMTEFDTTQGFLKEILALHRERPVSPHLEVETYTWDVLPEAYRKVGVAEAIARELAWVERELKA